MQGLATLVASLHTSWADGPVRTASPLHWAALLRLQPSAALEGFAALAAPGPAAEQSQPVTNRRATAAVPQAPPSSRMAEVQSQVAGIVAGVLGGAVEPDQSLMEVGGRAPAVPAVPACMSVSPLQALLASACHAGHCPPLPS